MLRLYDYHRSSASFRVRIALNLKGLSYEKISIHLLNQGGEQFTLEYRTINPQSFVPSLQDEDKIITQSLAIIEYLNELHPEPPLLPTDPYQKALTRSFALAIAADIHPLNNLRVLKYLKHELDISDEQKTAWYQHWITAGFAALEAHLVTADAMGDFCFGDKPNLADVCLVPQMYNARRFNCDLTPYPNLVRIDANCQKLPAFINAMPEE